MKESQVIAALSSLSHEARLKIVRKLIVAGEDGMTAGAIGQSIAAAPSKVSFHLASLEQAGLVSATRVSRNIVYRADYRKMGQLIQYLVADCCGGDARVLSCCSPLAGRKSAR